MSYLDDLFSVAGKTALVTGAATGIGRMAATALVSAGAPKKAWTRSPPRSESGPTGSTS